MNCQRCGTLNDATARFCVKCAAPVPKPGAWGPGVGPAPGTFPQGMAPQGMAPQGMAPQGMAPRASGPTAAAPLELWLEGLVTFDGTILEQFHRLENCKGRMHIATIGKLELALKGDKSYLDVKTVFGSGNLLIYFRAEQLPSVERLMGAINAARRNAR